MKIKALIFDFDGVICESDRLKTLAYRELYGQFSQEIQDKVVEYHLKHGGISRVTKIPYMFKEFCGIQLDEKQSKEWVDKYVELVYNQVINAPLVDGCIEFFEKYYKDIKIFVSSGTPQDEIRSIIKEKNLQKYFVEVFGSPKLKHEHINYILQKYNLNPKEVFFMGDAPTDRDESKMCGLNFAARITLDTLLQDEPIQYYDFYQLDKIIFG